MRGYGCENKRDVFLFLCSGRLGDDKKCLSIDEQDGRQTKDKKVVRLIYNGPGALRQRQRLRSGKTLTCDMDTGGQDLIQSRVAIAYKISYTEMMRSGGRGRWCTVVGVG